MKHILMLTAFLLAFTFYTSASKADTFVVCNSANQTVQYAYAEWKGDDVKWQTNFWFELQHDQCNTLTVSGSRIYLYADSSLQRFWRGDAFLCLEGANGTLADASNVLCDQDDQWKEGFIEVDIVDGVGTYRMTESNSLRHFDLCNSTDFKVYAAIAGANHNNADTTAKGWFGIEPDKCRQLFLPVNAEFAYLFAEGNSWKWQGGGQDVLCTNGSDAFNHESSQSMDCSAEGLKPQSFIKLPADNEGKFVYNFNNDNSEKPPVKLCNEFGQKIWSAIAYKAVGSDKVISLGWRGLEPNSCRYYTEAAEFSEYYVYAMTGKLANEWVGKKRLCLHGSDAFNIQDSEGTCSKHGERRRTFKAVDVVDGQASHTFSNGNRTASRSQIELCNDTDKKIFVAKATWDATGIDRWSSVGWYGIDAMSCATYDDVVASKMYLYAYNSEDNSINWAGNTALCSHSSAAFYLPKADTLTCDQEGLIKHNYFSWALDQGPNTYRFTDGNR